MTHEMRPTGDWISRLVDNVMAKVRAGQPLPDALREAADALHRHVYEDYLRTAPSDVDREIQTIRHRCVCGEDGIGPADWCDRERKHNHEDYRP